MRALVAVSLLTACGGVVDDSPPVAAVQRAAAEEPDGGYRFEFQLQGRELMLVPNEERHFYWFYFEWPETRPRECRVCG